MAIELDHSIVSARRRDASARQLAQLLGVPSGPAAAGPFYGVYVNEGLTLDFSNVRGPADHKVNTDYDGRLVYWNEPEGHQWEILTVSYARQPHQSD